MKWSEIYIQDDSAPVKRLVQHYQVFKNANAVKEEPWVEVLGLH